MADATNLIHAGLPWNNPLKITVKADLYISLLVINRGLLNLLSNDYYLDLKTERINQYINLLFDPHVNDWTIHWTKSSITDLIKQFLNGELGNQLDSFGLLKDTAFIIPITLTKNSETNLYVEQSDVRNINRIQNIINNCPKNLNGHTAIFALTPVVDDIEGETEETSIRYNHSIGDYYSRNKKDIDDGNFDSATKGCFVPTSKLKISMVHKAILLNGFYGGTIILMGNDLFTCESLYREGGKSLNTRLTRLFIEQIQNNIDRNPTKYITITGSGNNNTCSVVAFNNCNCDAYLWNLNVLINSLNEASEETINDNPYKRDLACFFPCNLVDDQIEGNSRFIVADTVNDLNFTETYLTLRAQKQTLTGGETEPISGTTPVSAICLSGDYLNLETSYSNFIQTFFGKYISNDQIAEDSLYEGATLCFWMKEDFYNNNINEVPILYSVDNIGNGYYIGLDKIVTYTQGVQDLSQYIETTFASKKRTDLYGPWRFWSIVITKGNSKDTYLISIYYTNPIEATTIPVVPSVTTNSAIMNSIKIPYLNFGYPISFFGTPDIRSNAYIRNILLFNNVISTDQMTSLANQQISDFYNLADITLSKSFKNSMKGALYVYNTSSMNIIGCSLSKR